MTDNEMITEEELNQNENIEQAYKVEIQKDIPDLWNRIEASLPEKEAKSKEKIKRFKISQAAALIAACLCVAIVIPVLMLSGGRSMETAVSDSSYEKSMGAAEEAAPAAEEAEMAAEAPAEDAAPAQEAMATDEASENKEVMVNEENEIYTPDVTVEILEFDESLGNEEKDGYQSVTVRIIEDASGIYEPDLSLNVYVEDTDAALLTTHQEIKTDMINQNPVSSSMPCIYMMIKPD